MAPPLERTSCKTHWETLGRPWFGQRLRPALTPLEPPLSTLKIHHTTIYRYRQPVSLGPHRLMLRPRESRDLRLISSNVAVTPAAAVTWAHDVFGNAVAAATYQTMADKLVVASVAEIQLNTAAW